MLPLNQAWAEAFRQEHPEVVFDIRGGGSSIGIDALIAGKIDIATASRTISPEEVSRIASHYRKIGLSLRVAKDHFSVFVHP
ncbi:MAG: substrate-binding domain-containing protein, partial [Calditrichaeota bacterium]|nr:substrate-binding domain-containing protein [Calditrichota bacterium]